MKPARTVRRLLVAATLVGALGPVASAARADFSDYGLASASASRSTTQAGAHPDLTLDFQVKTDPSSPVAATGLQDPFANTRNITIDLPPGLTGNPQAVPACTPEQFASYTTGGTGCPLETQVGVVHLGLWPLNTWLTEPIFNMRTSGDQVARLGYYAASLPNFINISVRSDSDYGLTATLENVPAAAGIVVSDAVLWGVPADPSHDTLRLTAREAYPNAEQSVPPRPLSLAPTAFLTNPTSCPGPLAVDVSAEGYQLPGVLSSLSAAMPATTGCGLVPFSPSITPEPTTSAAASPSGMNVDLAVPQSGLLDPGGLASADLKNAIVTLPEGMTLNTSSADGLAGCSEAQIGLISQSPIQFNTAPPACPDASKVGSATITTPVLQDPLQGSLYLADPNDNPFHTLVSGYLVAQGQGLILKIPGRFDLDPNTGRITATFDNNPQQPFSDLELDFKGSTRGVLTTPSQCGTYTIHSELTPWSSDVPVTSDSPFTINQNCGASGQSNPQLTAGVTSVQAGSSSSFELELTRQDGEQNISGLTTVLPPGLVAKLAGVPLCPDQLAASGDCPAGSQIGSTTVATGSGPTPLYIPQAGKSPTAVYLAGPYKGAPYSLVIKVPAQAGPFDLGTVTVRAGIYIDPTTAQVTVVSDPLPQIIQGIPLQYRDIRVIINRPGFIQAPTSCNPMRITATVAGAPISGPINLDSAHVGFATTTGSVSQLTNRFQVGGCQALPFSPKLNVRLTGKGKTRSGAHPTLTATLTQPFGQANLHTAKVALPLSLALDPKNSQHVCNYDVAQAVHGGAVACPASTIVGQATAVTPLLSKPLTGPVYLVQGIRFGAQGQAIHTLPSLLIPLRGQIALDLRAQSAVSGGKLVTTFATIPDAPVSKFTLKINGGRKGILVITGRGKTICGKKQVSNATFGAQSGKAMRSQVKMLTPCAAVKHKKKTKAKQGGNNGRTTSAKHAVRGLAARHRV